MNQTPTPTHGWAYPVGKGTELPKAHFYPQAVNHRVSICGKWQYRGQQVHTTLRSQREMCRSCHQRAKKMGFL